MRAKLAMNKFSRMLRHENQATAWVALAGAACMLIDSLDERDRESAMAGFLLLMDAVAAQLQADAHA